MLQKNFLKPKDDAETFLVGEASKAGRVSKTGIIKNVHILGFKSKNGREYSAKSMTDAVEAKIYNDVPIFINHDEEDVTRNSNFKDKMGFILESRYDESLGIIGDVQLNTGHPYYESAVWWVENAPDRVGFSHVAPIKESKDGVVSAIGKPYSLDFVSTPATTKGLLAKEGVIEDKIDENRLNAINCAVQDLFYSIRYPLTTSKLTQEEQALQYVKVLKDAIAELTQLGNSKKTTTEKESVMDMKTLTLELLKAERADLITAIATEAITAERAIDATVAEATKSLPETAKTTVFMKLIRESVASGKDVADIVADRKSVAVVVESAPPLAPKKEESKKEDEPKFDAAAFESTLLGK